MTQDCIPLDRLRQFLDDRLPADQEDAVLAHVESCSRCQAALDALSRPPPCSSSSSACWASEEQDALRVQNLIQRLGSAAPALLGRTLCRLSRPAADRGDTETDAAAADTVARDAMPVELADHAKYDLLARLDAGGGMGRVYRARHRLMERDVAIKVIAEHYLRDAQAVERFRREVKAAGQLVHPHIVRAYDAEQVGRLHLLVMEHVEGESLAQCVARRGRLPWAEACQYSRQAADALQHAHQQGMVHRDIKPHNLMLTPQGQVKVLDFGLARFVSEAVAGAQTAAPEGCSPTSPGAPRGVSAVTTQVGLLLGTPDFIAPEQIRDPRSADIRADIYSLGCTLYFLLLGRPPFGEGNTEEKLAGHLERSPPAFSESRANLPTGLSQVVERMMAKEPARRYATPGEVAAALAPFAGDGGARRPSRRTALVAGAAGLVILGGIAAGLVPWGKPPLPAMQVAASSADGRVSFWSPADPREAVRTWRAPSEGVQRSERVVFSPDAAWMATTWDDRVTVWNAQGEEHCTFIHAGIEPVVFVPGSNLLVTGGADKTIRCWRLLPPSEKATGLVLDQADRRQVQTLAASPGEGWLASGGDSPVVRIWRIQEDGHLQHFRDLSGHALDVTSVKFSPGGTWLASASNDAKIILWDVAKITGWADDPRITTLGQHRLGVERLAFSHDGRWLASVGNDKLVLIWDLKSQRVFRNLVGHRSNVWGVDFSPDDRFLATGDMSGAVRVWHIASGECVSKFEVSDEAVTSVAFVPEAFWPAE